MPNCMGDSSTPAVVTGLIIGIAFIVLFSISINPSLSPSDDQIIAAANGFPESKLFFSQYPNGSVEVDRTGSYGSKPVIVYQYEKIYDDGRINDARMFVGLNALTGMPTRYVIGLDCATSYVNGFGAMSVSVDGRSIIEALENTECAK